MKLKTLLAASAFAAAAVVLSGGAQARNHDRDAGDDQPQVSEQRVEPGEDGRERRQRGGDWGRHRPQQGDQPPPPPPQPQPGAGAAPGYAGGYGHPRGGYQPPPPPPAPPGYAGGYGHPRGGYQPPPPPPGVDPRYSGGYGRYRDRDWDRKRRRDRFRDGAAVVLGLGVLGALAAQSHDRDPYDRYGAYPQPGYQPDDQPGYDPGYEPGYEPGYQPGYGQDGPGYGGGSVIRCSSNDYRTSYCQIPQGARANIRRRLSSATCDYGRDWGIAPNAVWVANGCRAEFVIY